jgi:SET domain
VVSSAEAERRGIIYDRKFLSFLFDLNGDWVIDAARYGNKTRFINHADNEKDGLNCEAKIVLVNGEHRIKFVALRDINVGEELLFNYGKKFAEKHGLSKKLPKVKEGGKKGVLVGEALDALDGMDSRKRDTRGKMSAIHGGRAKGKGKMRKTAVVPEPVEEMEVDDDEVEEEIYGGEEESDEDEEVRDESSRRRRRITRPARYTR